MAKSKKSEPKKPEPKKPEPKNPATVLSGEDIAKERSSGSAPIGRPSSRTKAIETELFERLAAGESLRSICRDDHMPVNRTIFSWIHKDDVFLRQYEKAKERGCDAMAEEIFEIADDGSNDWMEKENKDGSNYEALNSEHVQRSRLRIDTRKWYLSKIKAKKYGDKLDTTVTHKFSALADDELEARITDLENQTPK